jgi:peptide/nickel transport system substrate-binding protein
MSYLRAERITVAQSSVALGDPHICSDSTNRLSVIFSVYETLVKRGEDGGFIPSLAESWIVEEGAHTWTFKLRRGVRFHNGDTLRAGDVVSTIARIVDPTIGGAYGTEGVYAGYLGSAEVSAPDDSTVRFALDEPIADLLDFLVAMPMAPESALGRLPEEYVGSGPFRVVEAVPDRVLTEAFPEYWGGEPPVKEVLWLAKSDRERRVEALIAGEVDIVHDVGLEGRGLIEASGKGEVCEYLSGLCIIFMCNAQKGVCRDARVRQALNYALDLDEVIDVAKGGAATPLNGFMTPLHFGYDPGTPVYPYDPKRARSLLEEAGHGGGMRLVIDIPTRMPNEARVLAELMTEHYAKVGVTVEVVEHSDREVYAHMVRDKGINDLCCFDSSPRSTFRVLREKIHSGHRGPWWEGYHNEDVNALIDLAQTTVDDREREGIYRRAYRMIRDDSPWVFLYRPTVFWGVGPAASGWSPGTDGLTLLT